MTTIYLTPADITTIKAAVLAHGFTRETLRPRLVALYSLLNSAEGDSGERVLKLSDSTQGRLVEEALNSYCAANAFRAQFVRPVLDRFRAAAARAHSAA
jgi:hypothetical protein